MNITNKQDNIDNRLKMHDKIVILNEAQSILLLLILALKKANYINSLKDPED